MWLLLVISLGNLTESARLDELRVSVLMDAAQSGSGVLFYYLDIGRGMAQHYALYDFETDEVILPRDSRLNLITDGIVAQHGVFYAENNEEVHVISPHGDFLEELRLQEFEGWREGARIDGLEGDGERVVALCHGPGGEVFLAELDFRDRRADFLPIRLPRMNRFTDAPEYALVPVDGDLLRIEVHTAEVVRLDWRFREVETLEHGRETVVKRKRHVGANDELEIFTKPFVVTEVGVSGKILQTRDHDGKLLDTSIPGGFLLQPGRPVTYSRDIVVGAHGSRQLRWNRAQQTIRISSSAWVGSRILTEAPND